MKAPERKPFFPGLFILVLGLLLLASPGCGGGDPSSWSLKLEGARSETISRQYFEDGVKDYHSARYTDEQGRVWEGMPLWYLVGRVDDKNKHREGAFNDSLADQGYEIEVVSASSSVKFTSREVKRNNNIILSGMMNGGPLPDDMAPLALVGSAVDKAHRLGKIISLKLNSLPQAK